MKAETTKENKARFFGLYWGQSVFVLNTSKIKLKYPEAAANSNGYLKLKPLSAISDEDAIELMFNNSAHFKKWLLACGYSRALFMMDHAQIDLLRSRGYALPWMGLSVEELIAAGWVRLLE